MGYTTDFTGSFQLDKPLTAAQVAYLERFCRTRRMARRADVTEKMPDPVRLAVGLPIGIEGEYYVGAVADYRQEHAPDIANYNNPPKTQPGLWCQWVPNDLGTEIEWDGGEKFYDYAEWLKYIIDNFLKPWGLVLNGEVTWHGEDSNDNGLLIVKDNRVTAKEGRIVYD